MLLQNDTRKWISWPKCRYLQKQDGGGRHLGVLKNSYNLVQDWLIRLKLCIMVENANRKRNTWPKMTFKIQDVDIGMLACLMTTQFLHHAPDKSASLFHCREHTSCPSRHKSWHSSRLWLCAPGVLDKSGSRAQTCLAQFFSRILHENCY